MRPNATKLNNPDYFDGHVHDFNDVAFRAGAQHQLGWVVAGPCVNNPVEDDCKESLIMRTVDGGYTWTVLTNEVVDPVAGTPQVVGYEGIVQAELTRINFTTEEIGWIVGSEGTILRSLDGGSVWRGVKPPSQDDVLDVSCDPADPNHCIAVTAKGAWASEDALREDREVTWAPLDLGFPADSPYTRSLRSVGVVDAKVAFIGAENLVLKTIDGGLSWTSLPMNYIEGDGNRVLAFPDGRGYVAGGNATHGRVFFLHDYAMESVAQTPLLAIPAGKNVTGATLSVEFPDSLGLSALVELSTDGGAHWQGLDYLSSTRRGVVREQEGLPTYAEVVDFQKGLHPENWGDKPVLRVTFHTTGDSTLLTPTMRNPVLTLDLLPKDDMGADPEPFVVELDLTKEATLDAGKTTAAWDRANAVLHQPLVDEYWTRNVSGEVLDVKTGHSVAGDARPEVWVATGGVLSSNSPDHVIYAGSDPSKYVKNDNRVYLLEGETGRVLARTDSFPGNVTHLAIGVGANGQPERVYATMWDPVKSNGSVIALDPVTLETEWSIYLADVFQPSALAASRLEGGVSSPVVGTRASETGQNAISGKVYSFRGADGEGNWAAIPDQLGRYVITKTLPTNWLFGPYVVEVEVRWTNDVNEVVDGVSVTKQVLQTARFYDYFLVTPPDSLSPPSPVYQVHLVTWFDDWR